MKIETGSSVQITKVFSTQKPDINTIKNRKDIGEIGSQEVEIAENIQINEERLIQVIEQANKSVKTYDRKLEFSIHDRTKQIMVKVIDTSGSEEKIIREIPPEKVLDMVAKLWEMAGILVDETA